MSPFLPSPSQSTKHRLGELLITDNIISKTQLDAALAYQKAHPNLRLGQILTEQLGIPQQSLTRGLHWQQQLRTTVLVFSLLAAPWKTAWSDTFNENRTTALNWAPSCQSSLCMPPLAPMTQITQVPALILEIHPKPGSNLLDLIGHGYEFKVEGVLDGTDAPQSYRVSISPKAIRVGWQFKF